MKNIILIIGITILKFIANIIYCLYKLLPIRNQIVMITRQSNDSTLDFQLLENYIKQKDKDIKIVILSKKLEKGVYNKIKYTLYILKIMYYLSTSKLCVIDSYCIPVSILNHKKRLKVVQIWHASGAVKKFGYQILDKKEGSNSLIAKLMCMHKNYDYVIAPSEITENVFSEAFDVPKDKIARFGLPRLEYIVNPVYDKSNEIYKQYPYLKDKKNILYIPTFRKNKETNLKELLNYNLDEKKYNLIIKLHPLDKTIVPDKYLVDEKIKSFDLIKIADYIITDYSVLSIEASILDKPIFFYLYDEEEYEKNRGLNINVKKELKSFTSKRFSDIMTKIEKEDYNMKQLNEYKSKYIEVNLLTAIKNLGEFLLKLYKE